MKRPTFFQGVVVAALLGLAGAAFVAALIPFVSVVGVARLLVPGLALAYLAYLVPRSEQRCGRVTVFALWSLLAIAAWLFVPSFAQYLLLHAGAIWLIRSLYFYSGAVPSLLDLGLTGFAAVLALGTLHRTGSVFLAAWSFFLVQALFVIIPKSLSRRRSVETADDDVHQFETARRRAEAALRQMIAP